MRRSRALILIRIIFFFLADGSKVQSADPRNMKSSGCGLTVLFYFVLYSCQRASTPSSLRGRGSQGSSVQGRRKQLSIGQAKIL